MVKFTSTIAIGTFSLPMMASALPRPIIDHNVRDLTIDVHDLGEDFDDLNARGFWKSLKNDFKKVGHGIEKVATSPVGQMAAKSAISAILRRDFELYDELEARGFWNSLKNDFKKVGHGIEKVVTSPIGQTAAKSAISAILRRDPNLYDELSARGLWQTVKKDAAAVGHTVENVANSPIGQAVAQAGVIALTAAKDVVRRDVHFDEFSVRDIDMKKRFFDEEFDGVYGRDLEINELD